MPNIISVTIIASSRPEAEKIADALVNEKLAACVNILPNVQSVYRWQGAIETTEEIILIAKTRAELFEKLCSAVKSLHSYSVPCIVATPVVDGYTPYVDWVVGETEGSPDSMQ
jgi:periplasmic divalent cation tolerance protein